uniref:Uncharacterized protein n=1 Tax=Romanomermis culicivorax TaxID=13658 RepID=A0A915IVS9_ROMCU
MGVQNFGLRSKSKLPFDQVDLPQATCTSASIHRSHSLTTGRNMQLPYNTRSVLAGPVYQSLDSHFERGTTSLSIISSAIWVYCKCIATD